MSNRKWTLALITLPTARGAIRSARVNWDDWRDVYQHAGPIDSNPLLTKRMVFGCFLWEYSVARTVGLNENHADGSVPPDLVVKAKRLQERLCTDSVFQKAITDGDAGALLDQGREIAKIHAAKKSEDGLHSLISKVAALCNPGAFIASDRFARPGLALLAAGTVTAFDTAKAKRGRDRFIAYQQAARDLARDADRWPAEARDSIRQNADELGVNPVAFGLRVVDSLAMMCGRAHIGGRRPAP